MFLSKLKETLICLKAGRVTLPYPMSPHQPAPGFRGQPVIDGNKCVGCGGCAAVCPPRLISIHTEDDYREVKVDFSRCTYCARCADVCPEGAMRMSDRFELATNSKGDLIMDVKVKMAKCPKCGAAFTTERLLRKTQEALYGKDFSKDEIPEWSYYCPDCRQTKTAKAIGGLEEPAHD